jgi:signal peptidase I
MIKTLSKIGYYFLIIAILILGGLLIFSKVPIEGNFEIKIVLSGSMEPSIKTGSVVVVKPVSRYEIGDVVTFGKDDRDNVPTTHRLIETRIVSGETRFVTKGDNNDDPDGREITESDIIGKVFLDIPYLGYILDMARKPWGFAVLIGIPALVIISDEVGKIWKEIKKVRGKKEEEPETSDE